MKKGFTLLELLIVIGILAILATTVVLVINPAQLLKKARDSQRISDLNSLKTAIGYYTTEAATPSIGATNATYSDNADGAVSCMSRTANTNQGKFTVDGNGWIPINFSGLAGGSPIAS
ncbi:type II secretion system protein, partial [Archaeoglobus sp.]